MEEGKVGKYLRIGSLPSMTDVDYLDDTDLIQTLEDVYSETDKQFVIVIDEWIDTFQSFKMSQELLKATWECDDDKVAELLETFHESTET